MDGAWPGGALAQARLGRTPPRPRRSQADKAANEKESPPAEEPAGSDNGPAGIVGQAAPTDSEAYRQGVTAVGQAKWDDAITALTEAIRLDPKSAAAYSTRGLAYTMKDNFAAALADLDTAIKLDPNNAIAYFNRGFAYYRKGDSDKAVEDYSETIRIDPKYANAYRDRGFIKTLRGKYNEALEDLNKAIQLDPKNEKAYVSRGMTYSQLGEWEKAVADFNQALQAGPQGRRRLVRSRLRPHHARTTSTGA